MTKKPIILATMLALIIGFVAYALSAQPLDRDFNREGAGGWEHSRKLERVAQYLDLDADQASQWLQITDDQRARRDVRRDQIVDLRARFKELADQSSPDLEALGQIALDIYTELESFRTEREQIKTELESILTPDQQERFEALQAARDFSGPTHHRGGRRPRFDPTDG